MISSILNKDVQFQQMDGYHVIIKSDFNSRLNNFLDNHYRAFPPVSSIGIRHNDLPYAIESNKFEWKFRIQSLRMLNSFDLDYSAKRILQFGPWNNWLTHHLKKKDNEVVCLDYFTDETGGLRSKKFFRNNDWISLQCDLEDISFFSVKFDLIIVNHCLQFFSDPVNFLEKLSPFCNPGGKIICLGVPVFGNATKKRISVENMKSRHFKEHGYDLLFTPAKGYLDAHDKMRIENSGFLCYSYSGFLLRNLYACLNPAKPRYFMLIKTC